MTTQKDSAASESPDYFDDGCVHGAERDECRICTAAASEGVPERCVKCKCSASTRRMEYCATCGCKCSFAAVPIQPRFTEGGQELAVCKHCGHEIIALSEPPNDRNWVHNNPHRNYPTWCQLETKAEPSDLAENVSAEAADAYLRGEGTIKKCEACGQDATLTNNFVTHLMERYQAKCEELEYIRVSPSVDEVAVKRAADKIEIEFPSLPNYAAKRIAEIITTELRGKQ